MSYQKKLDTMKYGVLKPFIERISGIESQKRPTGSEYSDGCMQMSKYCPATKDLNEFFCERKKTQRDDGWIFRKYSLLRLINLVII